MNILVYNIAAEHSGALTILEDFYKEVINYGDKSINWYFVVSTDVLSDYNNVKMIKVPWVKQSWFHRLFFDKFVVNGLVRKFNINKIFSMQNMTIANCKLPQIVYLHQPLQFCQVKFSFLKKTERSYWIRQNIISKIMKNSLKKADKIIVQTNWMKDSTTKWLNISENKVFVIPPKINILDIIPMLDYQKNNVFFYPASSIPYKNHSLIIDACIKLKETNISDYEVIFTLEKSDKLYQKVIDNNLNIKFIGRVPREKVLEFYTECVLLFPSYLETFGLPLLEARLSKSIIFASDTPFSLEILSGYPNAYFFGVNDSTALMEYMRSYLEGNIIYEKAEENYNFSNENDVISCLLG